MRAIVFCSVVALSSLAHSDAPAPTRLQVATTKSTATYHLIHKMHKVDAVSKKVEGKAVLTDGKAQVMIRIPVDSFDSENVNRDAHMKETVEAATYPTIELKAAGPAIVPATFPANSKTTYKVQLVFHGVKQLFEVPVELNWTSATEVTASTSFKISLDGFKVERPSLMFIKVDDELVLDAKLVFTP